MKIFLAGTYAEEKNLESVSKSKYLLESFYYIKPWQTELIHKTEMFLLDSGAFTFMQNNKTHTDWNEYLERYANFINENNIDYFFELDIDSVIGYENVLKLRSRLESLTNKQCIPVWHTSRGKQDFIITCEKYPYVAIGGIAIKSIKPHQYKYFTWFIDEAHKRNTQIHGLGFTNVSKLEQYHFDSVDSTRWNCARFGRLEYFDGKTIRAIDKRKDGKKLVGRKNNDIMKFTFEEWCKFQEYADTHY